MSFETTHDTLSDAGSPRHLFSPLAALTALIAVGMVLAPALGFVLLLVD
jgi:hypothetical protein